jgi:hypothetical protein
MMNRKRLGLTLALLLAAALTAGAQDETPGVLIMDHGREEKIIGPGAPVHTRGLLGANHQIDLDTGKKIYGLRYVAAIDQSLKGEALPGEGYIGMPRPTGANWYHGGFIDLVINGRSIGKTMLHSLTARSNGPRGTVDFVFDTPQAVVRVRFVARGGSDVLLCQARLEPKTEIKSLTVMLRCYPAGFISQGGARRVMSAGREIAQGEKADLDLATESWLLYYDALADLHQVVGNQKGIGPCAGAWLPEQITAAQVSVGGYAVETRLTLKPDSRDLRFAFLDLAGTFNAAAQERLKAEGAALVTELRAFDFVDPALRGWSLAEKQAEVKDALAHLPENHEKRREYDQLITDLKPLLEAFAAEGNIMAEARAADYIQQWERGLPELKLEALLRAI